MTDSGWDRPTPSRANTSLAAGVGGTGAGAGVASAAGGAALAALDALDDEALAAHPVVKRHHRPTAPRRLALCKRVLVFICSSPNWSNLRAQGAPKWCIRPGAHGAGHPHRPRQANKRRRIAQPTSAGRTSGGLSLEHEVGPAHERACAGPGPWRLCLEIFDVREVCGGPTTRPFLAVLC